MIYRIQEASFDLPDGLHDQTVNVFTATPSGESPFNIVVTRASVDGGTPLAEHVSRELAVLQHALAGYTHQWRRDHHVDGRPAEITAATVAGPPAMAQRQVYLIDGERAITITASARDQFSPEQFELLNQFLSSFRFVG